ncbi:systemin-like [Lycium barbarum]|uniref:systemin-like n=1 Tax=Lycium barbarum TaxID=112863 RepID=UPI00293EE853|nr:systemin-like [Lycium barbarum]
METPSKDIKNKGDDAQEKPKVENEEGRGEKVKVVENATPSQDIKTIGDDAQEKPKVEHEEGGDEKDTPSEDIKNKGDDAQEKPKVEHEEEKHGKERITITPPGRARGSAPPGKRDPPGMQTG